MPQISPDKDKKKDISKKKTEKPQSFEELILKEVFKCIKDYETLDEASKIKMQLLKIVLTKEFVPAKVGEAEMITKAVIESKIGKNECIEIEKVSKELIHLIKDKVAECEEIEKLVQKGSIEGLSKDDKDLRESVLRYSKTNDSRFVLAHFVQNEEDASKIVKAVIEGAKKDANKKSVSTKASKQKSIVNHSGIEELVADTYDLLDKLMRLAITLSPKEEAEERKQEDKKGKDKREEIAKLIGVVSGKRAKNAPEKRDLDSKIVLEN